MHLRLAETTTVLPMVSMWPARPDLLAPVVRDMAFRYRDTVRLEGLIDRLSKHRADPTIKVFADPVRMGYLLPRLEQIAAQLGEAKSAGREVLEFAESMAAFQRLLACQAKGQSIESLYLEAPPRIRDCIELGYGSLNQPILRLFEKILYQDQTCGVFKESLRFFCKADDREYSPVRADDPEEISWSIPFGDDKVSRLFSMDLNPMPVSELCELLQLRADDARIARYFRSNEASVAQPWTEDRTRVRYFGHACVLVERGGVSVLVDPLVPVQATVPGPARYSFPDLPPALDYVVITHAHADHFDIGSLLRLRGRVRCLVVPSSTGEFGDVSLKHLAVALGFENVVALDCLESITEANLEITALPFFGEHGDLAHGKATWLVRMKDDKLLFAADSKYVNTRAFEKVRRLVGTIQTVFIGTCCTGDAVAHHYSHLLGWTPDGTTDGRFTEGSNAQQAWDLVRDVGARAVYIYALGLEEWNGGLLGTTPPIYVQEASRLVEMAKADGLANARMLHGADTFPV